MWVAKSYLFLLAGLPWLMGRERSAGIGWPAWPSGPRLSIHGSQISSSKPELPGSQMYSEPQTLESSLLGPPKTRPTITIPGRSFFTLHHQTLRWALNGPPSPTLCHHRRIQMLPANHTALTNKAFARKQSPCTIRTSFDQVQAKPQQLAFSCCAGTTWAC